MHGNMQDLFISLLITILYTGHLFRLLSGQQTRGNFMYIQWGDILLMTRLTIEKRNYHTFNKGKIIEYKVS